MRTTLTLDDDVAALLDRVRKDRGLGLKPVVNEALRCGLAQLIAPPAPREPFRITPLPIGPSLIGDIDNIGDVLAFLEGEDYK